MKQKCLKDIYSYLFWVVALIGICCYTFCFARNREFWLDEAFLGMNILKRSYFQLWEPLDLYQVAPPLFLMISKFFFSIHSYLFLSVEQSLRLYPFLCGIGSIILFPIVIKKIIKNNLIGLILYLLFVFIPKIIYYAQEFKQYSSDVFWCLLVFYVMLKLEFFKFTKRRLFYYGLLFGTLVFLSHMTAFVVLASLGVFFFSQNCVELTTFKLNKDKVFKLFSFGIGYIVPIFILSVLEFLNPNDSYMHQWWTQFGAFLRSDLDNLFIIFYDFLDYFLYGDSRAKFSYGVIEHFILYDSVFIFFWGMLCVPIFLLQGERKKILFFSLLFLGIILASYLNLFPTKERSWMYAYSFFLLGFGVMIDLQKIKILKKIGYFFLWIFLLATAANVTYMMVSYRYEKISELRDAVQDLKSLPDDITPVFIVRRRFFRFLNLQDHRAPWWFYKDILNYNPHEEVLYEEPFDRDNVSINCFSYFNRDLKSGKKYALIWEYEDRSLFKQEDYKLPLDCFVRFGSAQSFQKGGRNIYLWTQK